MVADPAQWACPVLGTALHGFVGCVSARGPPREALPLGRANQVWQPGEGSSAVAFFNSVSRGQFRRSKYQEPICHLDSFSPFSPLVSSKILQNPKSPGLMCHSLVILPRGRQLHPVPRPRPGARSGLRGQLWGHVAHGRIAGSGGPGGVEDVLFVGGVPGPSGKAQGLGLSH